MFKRSKFWIRSQKSDLKNSVWVADKGEKLHKTA